MNPFARLKIIQLFVVLVFVVIVARLFYIQVVDSSYKEKSSNNVLRHETLFPPRGEVFDRSGEYIIQSKEAYDLMVVPRDVQAFDTMLLSRVVDVAVPKLRAELARAARYSQRKPSVVVPQLTKENKLLLDELNLPGFYTVYRTVRSYPRKIAGNLLGYVGEVDSRDLARDDYFRVGDYIGKTGIEQEYEEHLRGTKGKKINLVDVHGIVKGSYQDGVFDTLPVAGRSLTSSLDASLQAFAEELMAGKVGSVVAIEPSTGEILVMASSPTYDPDEMTGRGRNNNYAELVRNNRRPLFNRAVMANYPPGSTFKMINGLVGLQEGVLVPSQKYECHDGYHVGRGVKCHHHFSPLSLTDAIMTSCNAYFCYVLRNIMDNPKHGGIMQGGYENWANYVRSFGFGRRLGSDFTAELNGNVPTAEYYDRVYRKRWNSLTVISLAIGQGELGVSPLQMANLAATIANRGHFFIPHVIKEIEGEKIAPEFYEPHPTMVDAEHFEPIVEGMYKAVNDPGGTAYWNGRVEGLEMCGKTGTAQNPHGKDHSTFLGFAPRDNPRIAISVYVENAGFGSTAAVPIASLLMEQYLTDTVTRPHLVDYVKNMQITYPNYDNAR
ncbi:MAG: penicillin-binding protein 2 [Rikenellaceae bacterium]|jgi:penicillin-binding protein 2|nr:penicillin-binding protein 2 [Rikenellaceae bacterium]